MKWIRMSNAGDFDVVSAIQMIGASVKNTDNPIGLYGSGIKYAMAQALRYRISIKIASGGKVYTLTSKSRTFRGVDFDVVCLRSATGKIYETGITTDFGKEDWTDPWFIFREFYSNMLDEGGSLEVVDGVQTLENGVSVFIPYGVFKEQLDNVETNFTSLRWQIRPGVGNIYKSGVWVGNLKGCNFDFQSYKIKMTESRTMKVDSAKLEIQEYFSSRREDTESWKLLFESPDFFNEISVYLSWVSDTSATAKAIENALNAVVGKNYALCPLGNTALWNDAAQVYDLKPIYVPVGWSFPSNIRTVENIAQQFSERQPNKCEQTLINVAKKAIGDFIKKEFTIKVCDCDNGAGGYADIPNNTVLIGAEMIRQDIAEKTIKRTARIMLHEVNHLQTGAEDYTRKFGSGYEEYLIELMT